MVCVGYNEGKMAVEMVRSGMHLLQQIRLQIWRLELRNYFMGSYILRRKTL